MYIYIFTILFSVICTHFANKQSNVLFLHVLAVFLPIILLTFRDEYVGTDTPNYIYIYETASMSNSWIEYISNIKIESGFATLMYVIASKGLSHQWAFFACALFTILPVYIGCKMLRNDISPVYSMGLYYLMFYHYSFNAVRQSISMSLMFMAMAWLLSGKKTHSAIIGLIATSFHNVAFIFIIVYLLYVCMIVKKKTRIKVIILSVLVLGGLLYYNQVYYANSLEYYIQSYLQGKEVEIQLSYFIEMMFNFIIVFIAWRIDKNSFEFFLLIALLVLFFISLSTMGPFLYRVAYCLDILLLIYIPLSLNSISPTHQFHKAYMAFAIFYWWFVFIYNNSGETIPYMFNV